MKNINAVLTIVLLSLIITRVAIAQECTESQSVVKQEVAYAVNKGQPAHLKGATIIVRLADGTESKVSADKFMVVPRKQYTKLGVNTAVSKQMSCKATPRKNIISGKLVDGYSDVSTKINGKTATLKVDRQLGVGLQYQRQLGERIYLGVGGDSNKGLEGLFGFSF